MLGKGEKKKGLVCWWASGGTKGQGTGRGGSMDSQCFNTRTLLGFQTASVGHVIDFKVVEEVSARFGATKTIRSLCKTNNGLRNQH